MLQIQAGVSAAGGLKKKMFDAGLAAKTEGLKRGELKNALYDRLIFDKIKKGLGLDQVQIMVSGSAPISATVMTFYRCMLGIYVVEGYGQTEGGGVTTTGSPADMITEGHVGGPASGVEVVLVDVPEMGYLHTDTDNRGQACVGRGEICFRGPNVFKGYYKDEEKTRETIDDEGWLHSGDIGLWRPDGSLQIIDRKKNIFKLSQGEYVAPEKIETIISPSPLISQCFVYGDSLQSALVAIIVPDEDSVRNWAASRNESLAKEPFEKICKSEELNKAIMSDIRKLSKESKLNGFETVKAIYLDSSLFSVENGMLTPTFKLKRQKARDQYEKEIIKLYAGLPPPQSKL
jgi:long-chain acyl-CoA synthetase